MRNSDNLKIGTFLIMIGIGALALMLCSGCVMYDGKNVTDSTSRVLGLDASYQGTGVRFGIVSTSWHITPVSTNQLYSARHFDALSVSTTIDPFNQGFDETTASGDVAVSTNATGQAILPKMTLPKPR